MLYRGKGLPLLTYASPLRGPPPRGPGGLLRVVNAGMGEAFGRPEGACSTWVP